MNGNWTGTKVFVAIIGALFLWTILGGFGNNTFYRDFWRGYEKGRNVGQQKEEPPANPYWTTEHQWNYD